MCITGRCKVREQHPLFHYNHLKSLVLCPKVAIPLHESEEDEQYNHTDHKRACVEGSCHGCGVWDAEGSYNPKLWIMSCPLEVRYSCLGHHTYILNAHTHSA